MYLPHGVRHTKITIFASRNCIILHQTLVLLFCAWHFMYENVFKYARICAAGFTNLRSQNNNVLLSDP